MFLVLFFLLGIISISQSATLPRYESQIINGRDAAPGEIPYQVSLQQPNGFHFCGGSILSEYYIITAAHCVVNTRGADVIIIAGTINLNRPKIWRTVKNIIVHDQYNPNDSWLHDIALIQVFTPFTPSPNIGFVTLPAQDEAVEEGSVARVSGFGRISQNGPGSNTLRKTNIFIANQEYCKKMYSMMAYDIYNTHICANDPNVSRGSCKGDSGGPLIVDGKIVGLVSWAKACSLTDYPTVYTRVPSYINWIKENAV